MSQDIVLNAEKRDLTGKAVLGLRAQGQVPAVVQEHGKDSINITVSNLEMMKVYQKAGMSQAIDLTVGDKKLLALIKEIQFVNLKPEVEHVVFQALKQDEAVDAEVPIHLIGDAPAEQNQLAVLKTLESLVVRALPRSLPEALEVSAEGLTEIDDRVDVKDIKLPEGVELVELIVNADDEEKKEEFLSQPIALVKEPHVEEEPEPEVEEGAEGEVPSEHGGESEEGEGSEGGSSDESSEEKSE